MCTPEAAGPASFGKRVFAQVIKDLTRGGPGSPGWPLSHARCPHPRLRDRSGAALWGRGRDWLLHPHPRGEREGRKDREPSRDAPRAEPPGGGRLSWDRTRGSQRHAPAPPEPGSAHCASGRDRAPARPRGSRGSEDRKRRAAGWPRRQVSGERVCNGLRLILDSAPGTAEGRVAVTLAGGAWQARHRRPARGIRDSLDHGKWGMLI